MSPKAEFPSWPTGTGCGPRALTICKLPGRCSRTKLSSPAALRKAVTFVSSAPYFGMLTEGSINMVSMPGEYSRSKDHKCSRDHDNCCFQPFQNQDIFVRSLHFIKNILWKMQKSTHISYWFQLPTGFHLKCMNPFRDK